MLDINKAKEDVATLKYYMGEPVTFKTMSEINSLINKLHEFINKLCFVAYDNGQYKFYIGEKVLLNGSSNEYVIQTRFFDFKKHPKYIIRNDKDGLDLCVAEIELLRKDYYGD